MVKNGAAVTVALERTLLIFLLNENSTDLRHFDFHEADCDHPQGVLPPLKEQLPLSEAAFKRISEGEQ